MAAPAMTTMLDTATTGTSAPERLAGREAVEAGWRVVVATTVVVGTILGAVVDAISGAGGEATSSSRPSA
jgi:hypothetical protein